MKQSGITFHHHALPYATDRYIANHYDHGTGVAVADVDGDGLYDLYFVNQVGGNELWKNLGNGKFKNITDEAGVGLKDRISAGAAFADVDNSGHEDLYVTTVNQGNKLFQNDGHGHFKDITQEAGVGLIAHSSGAMFFDYDNDGLVDLLVCNVGVYTSDQKGSHGEYVGLRTHSTAICIRNVLVSGSLQKPGTLQVQGRDGGSGTRSSRLVWRRDLRRCKRRWLAGYFLSEYAGL